jgi:hypothetical protein
VPAFVVVQLIGGVVGTAVIRALYPNLTPDQAAGVMLPQVEPFADAALAEGIASDR